MKKLRSIEDLDTVCDSAQHVLTLFSGGLDSTYILELLSKKDVKVTALVVDLGAEIDVSSLGLISKHYDIDLRIVDAKNDLVEGAIVAAIRSQALYLGDYPVSSSLSRPCIVKKAVEVAQELNCDAIIHSANQSQNSLRRLNGAIESSTFDGFYGSPYEYSALTREEKSNAVVASGLVSFKSRNVSGDENLWCREFESGILDDPENFNLPESLFTWSKWDPLQHFDHHQVNIGFFKGYPVTINNHPMDLIQIISTLNSRAGAYEMGRYVGFDHLDNDEKVLEIREAPAATLLMRAYKLLETAILPTDVLRTKSLHNDIWTQEAVEGRWESVLKEASYAFIQHTSTQITGHVTFQLSRGNAIAKRIVGRHAKYLCNRDDWEVQIAQQRSLRSLPRNENKIIETI
ncbi:argininosuccinate synthase-related protein [Marinomonas sp. THO17]|uniref:argininosuccinate synthase-related protein n=1 Tax=Marinomonas sp. THO17 TaxID=3149048 RepID=UPI00336BC290